MTNKKFQFFFCKNIEILKFFMNNIKMEIQKTSYIKQEKSETDWFMSNISNLLFCKLT